MDHRSARAHRLRSKFPPRGCLRATPLLSQPPECSSPYSRVRFPLATRRIPAPASRGAERWLGRMRRANYPLGADGLRSQARECRITIIGDVYVTRFSLCAFRPREQLFLCLSVRSTHSGLFIFSNLLPACLSHPTCLFCAKITFWRWRNRCLSPILR